ncbi:MAG TPA: BamA/TamA family outer membrane protein [Vicinamibacteria bacterium]|nr:BamA/TamA family outer membrane protein [Vicinamibacteria bacterium]
MRLRRGSWAGVLGAVFAFASTTPADAQYFGRTPVQWERLEFKVLKTEHFDIYYYPEEQAATEQVARMAERWYARLSRVLGYEMKDRQPLVLYASHPHFQQTNTIGGPPGEGTGGVTEAFKRRIVLPMGASLAETDHVLGHELVHAFQFAITGQGKVTSTSAPGVLTMPLWFVEGMAEYLSVGPIDAHTAMWMRDAARREKLPTIRDLAGARYFPYRYGQALWAYLAGRFGDEVVRKSLAAVGPRSADAATILAQVVGVDDKTLSKEWHAALRDAVAPHITGRKDASAYGTATVTEKRQGGRLNVAPALSPDGQRLAFLSERDRFSIELFVADAVTGDVTRRLSRTLVDPHLESLQFISSAGAWDRAGQRIALGAVSKGRPLLAILDAKSGERVREVPLPTLGEIYTPSFSPDGRRVVFSGLAGGVTDLFVYDLEKDALTRMTDDAYADLQPAWSPDGTTIAFTTDRFSTHLATLDTGNYRLAALDVDTRAVRPLPGFPAAKNINPQWDPSGRGVYFLSDATGATNVYRLEVAEGQVRQLTDLITGVSGITALSPALSVASSAGRIAFSVYDEDRYEIYSISDPERLAGWPVEPVEAANGWLIPGARATGEVLAANADAEHGLAETSAFAQAPYKPKLTLDYVGQSGVGVGYGGRYGTSFGGGVAMSFSDMLGQHTIDTVLQVDRVRGFSDVGGMVAYVNKVRRFNWGLQVSQLPYMYGGYRTGVINQGGEQVYVEQLTTERWLDRTVGALGYYPFNPSLRLELQSGYRSIGFETRVDTQGVSLRTGRLVIDEQERLPGGENVHLFESTVALVRDTSVFGATSPVMGQRARLDLSPTLGSVNYTSALADLRQYVMPVRPVTLAGRVLHYGRYGSGGEDQRLGSLFLGYPNLVRGYDSGSFGASECGTGGGCPVYDRLLGSRLLVGNVEVRAPLFGLFGAKSLYGPVPIEVGAFFDAGVAWHSASRPALFGGERHLVKSLGGTARLNLFGFAVLQLDYVKPLDRPGKNAYFTFNLLSGF